MLPVGFSAIQTRIRFYETFLLVLYWSDVLPGKRLAKCANNQCYISLNVQALRYIDEYMASPSELYRCFGLYKKATIKWMLGNY